MKRSSAAPRGPRGSTGTAGLYVLMIAASVPFIGPLIWMLSTSLKSEAEVFQYPPSFVPTSWRWQNYAEIFEMQPFALQYWNSVYIAAIVTAVTVMISSLAGYAFARLRFRGSGFIFLVLLSGMFIPDEVVIVPLYRYVSQLGLVDTHWPLIVIPIFSGGAVVGTFIMRQAFLSIPRELEDAARIDGLGFLRTYWSIALPLVRPSMVVVVILSFWSSWNLFLEPLVFLRTPEQFTLPLALTQFVDPFSNVVRWNIQMAATTLAVVPVVIVFLYAQRYVIAGMTSGAVKG